MFIGHWAPALAAATHRKAPTLGTLFVAAQLVDWLFFAFLLLGVEHMRMVPGFTAMNPMDLYDMPITHSLLGSLFWSVLFGGLIWAAMKDRVAGLVAGAVVFSHWLLDLLVHAPDLTIAGSPPKFGLGLWNHPEIEMPLEVGIVLVGLAFYWIRMRPSAVRITALAAVLALLQAINWFGGEADHVTAGTSLLAFFAYGLATLAAWWVGKSAQATRQAV